MTTKQRAWLYLFLAAGMEACWFYSIQWMKKLSWAGGLSWPTGPLEGWLGVLAYAGFGIANALLFLKAAKHIRSSIAFSVWTGTALVIMVLTDQLLGLQALDLARSAFLTLILIGVWGLKTGEV
jgi:quaternary ammonium compound-resistance protein SugE